MTLAMISLSRDYRMIDDRLFDWFSTTAAPVPVNSPVIIVAIDESSFRELERQWPWPREIHGALIESLARAGAAVIALDILFAEPTNPESDRFLADAIEKAPPVVLAADETLEETPHVTQIIRTDPLDLLLAAGAVPGVAAVTLNRDGILRALPLRPDGFAVTALNLWLTASRKPSVKLPAIPTGSPYYLQFVGPARSYPTVSYYQALVPEEFLPPGIFKNRVVLVGKAVKASPETRAGETDAFATPYTRSAGTVMAGVEVQATIFDNLRLGLFIRPAPGFMVLAALAVFVVLLGLVLHPWRPRSATITMIALIVVMTAASFLLLRYGRAWISPSLFVLAALMIYVGAGGTAFVAEQAARRHIRLAFSRYLAPALVDQLAADRSRLVLGGEIRDMTLMFCDVRGFTALSERFAEDPQGLVHVMNRLFSALTAVILKHGGTVDKFIGDCIMAFWNAPLEVSDHAARACAAALDMIAAVSRLNDEFAAEPAPAGNPAPKLDVGIGINTGPCVVGNIGAEQRFDYSVLGDPVNLASRLEGQSKTYGTRIVVGPETAAAAADMAFLELDLIAVKGKTRAMHVFALMGGPELRRGEAFSRLQERHNRLLGCFRKQEWAAARTALAACRELAPDQGRLHDLYSRRIDHYEIHPPEEGWAGVYVADTK
ncbi:MAG: adenylate/guanylate cyclase domain-containing protein [Thermodesulfobacteriota bacterium]